VSVLLLEALPDRGCFRKLKWLKIIDLKIGILSLVHYIASSCCVNPSMGCCGRGCGEALGACNLSKVALKPILEICSVARWRLSCSRIEKIKLFLYKEKNEQFNASLCLQATTSSSEGPKRSTVQCTGGCRFVPNCKKLETSHYTASTELRRNPTGNSIIIIWYFQKLPNVIIPSFFRRRISRHPTGFDRMVGDRAGLFFIVKLKLRTMHVSLRKYHQINFWEVRITPLSEM